MIESAMAWSPLSEGTINPKLRLGYDSRLRALRGPGLSVSHSGIARTDSALYAQGDSRFGQSG